MAASVTGAVPGADDVESSDPYVVRARLVREAVQTLRNRVGASELTRVYLKHVDTWEKGLVERAPKLAALTTALYKSASRLTDPLHREAHDVFVRAIDMTRTNFRTVVKLHARRATAGQKLDAEVHPRGHCACEASGEFADGRCLCASRFLALGHCPGCWDCGPAP